MKYGYGKWLPGLLGGLLLACAGGAAAQVIPVRILAQEASAPKWIVYEDHVEGICADIIAALERVEPRLRFFDHARGRSLPAMDAGLASGAVGAACALLDSPQRRAAAQAVGKPLYPMRHLLAARADDQAVVRGIHDLARLGATVSTVSGSAFAPRLAAAGVPVDDSTGDQPVNLRKVLAGHGRFSYMDELSLEHYIRAHGLQERIRLQPLLADQPAWFWVSRKADPRVAGLIGAALARLRASGELERIRARWSRR